MSWFQSPKNYIELLSKLNWCTFLTTLIFFIVLRYFNLIPHIKFDERLIPPIKDYKALFEWIVSFGVIPFFAAVFAWFLSKFFEIHNKIEKFSKVRFFWDKYFIAKPLAGKTRFQAPLTFITVKKIMNEFYYPNVRNIESHYVELFWNYALWFWVLFEHTAVVFVTAIIISIIYWNNKVCFLWGYFAIISIFTAIQLIFVTGPKSTDQANQISEVDIQKFFDDNF